MNKLKKDVILILCILIAAFLIWLVPAFFSKKAPVLVKIMQDGQEIGTYSLLKDQTVFIPWGDENYNLLFISDGEASVTDADCPDGLCVKARNISKSGESIICLPHKLVIQIESKEEGALDAVTY